MFKIYPSPEIVVHCPLDNEDLILNDIQIPGMRCLADTVCPVCDNKYLVDLPVGQAIWSPVTLNKDTCEVYDKFNITWFSQLLVNSYKNISQQDIVPIVHKFYESDRIVIINCLDFLYGHSLLKLLNVQRYLDEYPDLDCCVLVPTQLVHLVPDGVAEIWEVPIKIKEGSNWYASLNIWIKNQIVKRSECYLSKAYSHPGNQYYDIDKYARNLPDISDIIDNYHPIILYNYRQDRRWGRSLENQRENIQKLYDKLSNMFNDMAFVIVGFGTKSQFIEKESKIVDLRKNSFNVEDDKLWMAFMKHADCAIGVHGSNMLLPSGLSKTSIEIVPLDRIANTIQSFLFPPNIVDIRDSLLRYRMLYGDEELSNVFPSQVVDLVMYLLSYVFINEEWFKVGSSEKAMEKLIQYEGSSTFRHISSLEKKETKTNIQNKLYKLANKILRYID